MQTYRCPLCRIDIQMAKKPGNTPMHVSHTKVEKYAKDLGLIKGAERFEYNRNMPVFEIPQLREIVQQWCEQHGPHACLKKGTFHLKGQHCGNSCDTGCKCIAPAP